MYKLYLGHSESKIELMILMFPLLKKNFYHVGVVELLQLWLNDIVLVQKFQIKQVHLQFPRESYDPHYLFHKE